MLKISEIYPSIQGESSYVGYPFTIIRLAGCNLECSWCDTPYAFEVKKEMTVEGVLDFCRKCGLSMVLVTGGEPLLQEEVRELMRRLASEGYTVLLETNGSLPLEGIPAEVVVILDFKCPASGMQKRMLEENLEKLRPKDEVKFIIADRDDFDHAVEIVKKHRLAEKAGVLFSPVFDRMKSDVLAEWILETRLPVRLNLQIHKYIWGPRTRGR